MDRRWLTVGAKMTSASAEYEKREGLSTTETRKAPAAPAIDLEPVLILT